MYLEFLPERIPCCRSFKPAHVATVPKLSLRVAANDIVVENFWHPVLLLCI